MDRLSVSSGLLILLVIAVISVIKCSETGRVERPASYHPRRLRMVYRDRMTPRKYILATRDLEVMGWTIGGDLKKLPGIKDIVPIGQVQHSWKRSAYEKEYPDPLWTKQWYVQDYRKAPGPVMDLNVVPAYRKGITGKGVTVAVVDAGIERDNPDLVKNYWKEASYDYTKKKRDEGLVQNSTKISNHGTLCAGIISMEARNSHCGVGIAYDAKLIDVKAVGGGDDTDVGLGKALNHRLDVVDIYSYSLGPSDDGDYLGEISQPKADAFVKGVTEGRGGRGAIYVLPSGNGGLWGDNCSWDGQANSIRTISIAGASFRGRPLSYGEPCSAVFATTYLKSWAYVNEGAVTTATGKGCSKSFSGTSAATPLAAGMFALMLQAK